MLMSFWSGKRKELPVHILKAAQLLKSVFVYGIPGHNIIAPTLGPAHQWLA